ncbi:SRPBCC family protein [Microbacterium sp. SORGH_AS_0888]|uniref:aromatase/cyclase n=1 Tax=Microbacterium sp. SORGH_AS_0888 TaxID=3041791 RepID=UPI002787F3E9|nr:SRPBCC family protein [Microbacterium sp. SORGH_AS_0888]MDQ1128963.1 aromatase [Microbacterium sp. SORGH_AS_0888]
MIERETAHEIRVEARAERIYDFLSDVTRWADIFPPTIYAERVESSERQELIQIWATANGTVRTWRSRRTFEPEKLRITFAQTQSAAPVIEMSGTWEILAEGEGTSIVKLGHAFTAHTKDDADFIDAAVDTNSQKELESLREFFAVPEAEYLHGRVEEALPVSASADDAFEFLLRADRWAERIPHVVDATLTRFDTGGELLRLVTQAKDGSTHETASYRVVLSDSSIVYKQIETPGALVSHRGEWHVFAEDGQTFVKSVHEYAVTRATVTNLLGPEASLAKAIEIAGTNLMHNSTQTIKLIGSTTAKVAE